MYYLHISRVSPIFSIIDSRVSLLCSVYSTSLSHLLSPLSSLIYILSYTILVLAAYRISLTATLFRDELDRLLVCLLGRKPCAAAISSVLTEAPLAKSTSTTSAGATFSSCSQQRGNFLQPDPLFLLVRRARPHTTRRAPKSALARSHAEGLTRLAARGVSRH